MLYVENSYINTSKQVLCQTQESDHVNAELLEAQRDQAFLLENLITSDSQ